MPGLGIDLNEEPPESANLSPIDWDEIDEYDGSQDDDGSQRADELQGDADAADGVLRDGAATDSVNIPWLQGDAAATDGFRKRKHYPDDLKIAIYLDLLAKTDPPILRRGVTKSVSEKFDVPLRVVQAIWKNGQGGGMQGIVNKYSKKCGRKRVEIDLEAIKSIPLKQRSTFQDLANAIGVKKSTLYNRFKEGYFHRHTDDLKFSLTDEKTQTPRPRSQ